MKVFELSETLARISVLNSYKRQTILKSPDFLFHYTNPIGLLGIVSSGSLWMSDSNCLNDSKELLYFKEVVKNCCENICSNKASENFSDSYKKFVSELGEFALAEVGSVFVVSLSEHRDQLSQWRGYAGGGQGYALGFRARELAKSVQVSGMVFGRCNYNYQDAYIAAIEIINSFIAEFFNGDTLTVDMQTITYEFSRSINIIAPLFKHSIFAEEAEWRVFCYTHWQDARLEYRSTPT